MEIETPTYDPVITGDNYKALEAELLALLKKYNANVSSVHYEGEMRQNAEEAVLNIMVNLV